MSNQIKNKNGLEVKSLKKISGLYQPQISKANGLEDYFDANHTYVWGMQEASGTAVNSTVNESNMTADAGVTITTNYAGGNCRSFSSSNSVGISISEKVLPQGAKTIRFKIKPTGTLSNGYIITNDDNSSGSSIFIEAAWTLYLQYRASGVGQFSRTTSALAIGTSYDVHFTYNGTNTIKSYIKVLTGTYAGKWINSSGVYSDTIVENSSTTTLQTETAVSTTTSAIGIEIPTNPSQPYPLKNVDLWDFQISNIARTDMID